MPLAAAANEMMNACRGLGIDDNDFVVAHQVYRRLGGQNELEDSMSSQGEKIGAALAKAMKGTAAKMKDGGRRR